MVSVKNSRRFEDALVRQCAPTLAGMKPGSIFCIRPPVPEDTRRTVRQWDQRLDPLGLSVQILSERPGPAIVYVYRRSQLERVLEDENCQTFLADMGYAPADLDGLLAQLALRLKTQTEFPHEIGVFLGYPLRDVTGFIENHGQNFTCCGFWKSYGDPAEMQAYFARCRKCIHTYMALLEQGCPLEKLAV